MATIDTAGGDMTPADPSITAALDRLYVASTAMEDVIRELEQARDLLNRRPPGREVALAITEAETAKLWLEHARYVLTSTYVFSSRPSTSEEVDRALERLAEEAARVTQAYGADVALVIAGRLEEFAREARALYGPGAAVEGGCVHASGSVAQAETGHGWKAIVTCDACGQRFTMDEWEQLLSERAEARPAPRGAGTGPGVTHIVTTRSTASGSQWLAECACGWRSAGHADQADADTAAREHVQNGHEE